VRVRATISIYDGERKEVGTLSVCSTEQEGVVRIEVTGPATPATIVDPDELMAACEVAAKGDEDA
jgi:hypothetical protein